MMKLWSERYAKATPLLPSAVASVVVHAALIGASVAATAGQIMENVPLPPNSIARFLAPPNRSSGQQPRREMIRYMALALPEGSAAAVPTVRVTQPRREVSGLDEADAHPLPALVGMDSVFSIVDVDSAASRYEWSAAPSFPPRMLAQSQDGYVRAEWVVDENGYADTTTLRVLQATHDDFTQSLRDALPFMRFRAAKIGTTPVRQLVVQEFSFRITTASIDTTRIRRPPR